MVPVLRFRRYRTLILFSCIIVFGIYQLNKSNTVNGVPAKFMKPSMPGRPPADAAPVGSASKISGILTSKPGSTENSPPEKLVKDINEDLGPAEDTAYRVEYPPVDENSVDDETVSTQEPQIIQSKPLTVNTYEGTYSPDDHRVDSNSITTPAMPLVENIFTKSRVTKFPIARMIPLPDDPPISFPKIQGVFVPETPEQRKVREERLNAVREAFVHSWNGYKAHAWGHDEVRPVTNGYADPFGGWGASIVDALDSLQIMGLSSELEDAKKLVASIDFTKSNLHNIPVFETVIRYLGGLISAFDLSNGRESVFLSKAVELADLLLGAFDTPNGMPVLFYDPQLAHRDLKLRAGKHMVLAQFASLSLEFTRLAQLTGNQVYYSVIQRVMDQAEASLSSSPIPGLWPLRMDISGCTTEEDENGKSVSVQRSATPPLRIPKDGSSDSIRPSQQLQNKINDAAAEAIVDEEATPSEQKLVKRQLNLEENKDGQVRSTTLGEVSPPDSNIVIPPAKPDPKCVNLKGLTESIRDRTTRKISAGALGDSAYEYLVKQYLLLGGTVGQYKTLYETTSASIKRNLLYRPMVKGDPDILFAGNAVIGPHGEITKDYEMTHLSCFLGGMYALGSRALELQDDIKIGAKLADGCYWAYNATRTGIMPENFHVEHCSSDACHWVDPRERHAQTDNKLRNRILKKRQESNVVIPEEFQIIPENGSPIAESHVDSVSSGETVTQEFLVPDPESLTQKDVVSAFPDVPQSNEQFPQTKVQASMGAVPNEEPVSEKQTTDYPASGVIHSGPGMDPEHSVEIRTEETKAKADAPIQVATTPPADTSSQDNTGAPAIEDESVIGADYQMSAAAERTSEQATEQLSQHSTEELQRSAPNLVSREPQSEPLADLPTGDQMKNGIETTAQRTESTTQTPGTVDAPQYQEQSETPARNGLVDVGAAQHGPGSVVEIPDSDYKRSQLDSEAPARAPESRITNEGTERAANNRNDDAPEQSAMKSRDQPVAVAEVGTVSPSDSGGAVLKDEADGSRASVPGAQTKPAQELVEDDTDRWEVGGWYDQPRSFLSQDGRYLLRPEALESIFILYRVTGDKQWQDKGWQMFSAINKYCRTATAFSAISDVTDNMHNRHMDEMESFWMAETLKYAYLLFADPSLISLDDYVFNTEAHPFLRPSPVTNAPE
ncbi:glycoside hydrolase [Lipomyces chichibuensis]|uniref:glycoside hydrolase n=1 Tax=Lipomyces chichibuensis TaxID=1546026 RepID=UPI0033431207